MVILRFKALKSSKYSIYLDCYISDMAGNKSRKYEFLKKYVSKDYSKVKKVLSIDKETMMEAEIIRQKRQVELSGSIRGIEVKTTNQHSLTGYLKLHHKKTDNKATKSILHNINKFTSEKDVLFSDVTPAWLDKFQTFLLGNVAHNTARDYLRKLDARFKDAIRDDIINYNPFENFETPVSREVKKHPLSIEEVGKLVSTDFPLHPQLRLAFLFSTFCGLRYSDVRNIRWDDIYKETLEDGTSHWMLGIKPLKTIKNFNKSLKVPLTKSAVKVLGFVKKDSKTDVEPGTKVFSDFPTGRTARDLIKLWAASAGIEGNMHFHRGRHSFATICLSSGIDIYTVSKLLGHRSVRTTEVYAKLTDEKKRMEIKKIPTL